MSGAVDMVLLVGALLEGVSLAVNTMQDAYKTAQRQMETAQETVKFQRDMELQQACEDQIKSGQVVAASAQMLTDEPGTLFLFQALGELKQQLGQSQGARTESLRAAIDERIRQVANHPDQMVAHTNAIFEFHQQIAELSQQQQSETVSALAHTAIPFAQQVQYLRSMLDTALIRQFRPKELEEMKLQIARLEIVAEQSPEIAAQGYETLTAQLRRLMLDAAEHEQHRRAGIARIQQLLAVARPALAAVMTAQELVPHLSTRSTALKQAIKKFVTNWNGGSLEELEALSQNSELLYHQAQQYIQKQAAAELVYNNVTASFQELGYEVMTLNRYQGRWRGRVALTDTAGIEFISDPEGGVLSDTVTTDINNVAFNPELEQKVCTTVDEVLEKARAKLAGTGVELRERSRVHGRVPRLVRSLQRDTEEQTTTAEAPKTLEQQ